MCRKQKGSLRVYETNILEAIFMILFENSSLVANDTQGPQEYQHQQKKMQGHISIHVTW